MTFEEIKAKFEACASVSITEIKEIQYGKCICLSNGGKINCFNSGKYTVQGKAQDQVNAILEGMAEPNNRKIFVVYGHDEIARTQLEALLRRWDLEPIILDQRHLAAKRSSKSLKNMVLMWGMRLFWQHLTMTEKPNRNLHTKPECVKMLCWNWVCSLPN